MLAFIGKYDSGSDSSDEGINHEELAETYRILYIQWKETFKVLEK